MFLSYLLISFKLIKIQNFLKLLTCAFIISLFGPFNMPRLLPSNRFIVSNVNMDDVVRNTPRAKRTVSC